MSKRFVDTARYRQAWRKLDPKLRAAYYWLTENADAAGFWKIDLDHFKFECGYALDLERFIKETGAAVQNGDVIQLKDFIEINYGTLKEGYNPHKPALRALARHQNSSLNQASTKFEDEDEDEDNTQGRVERAKPSDGFEEFYKPYPLHKARGAAERAWAKLTKEERALCKPAIEAQVKANHFRGKDGKDYIPHPATWLNERRWLDEVVTTAAQGAPGIPDHLKDPNRKPVLTWQPLS